MATIDFTVGVPSGAPTGGVDAEYGYISTYLALDATGYPLQSNMIFCIAPDLIASSGQASYTVHSGISGTGLSLTQVNELKGIFSHYIDSHDTSFANQEATMIADWTIVNPSLSVTGVPANVINNANQLITDALAGHLAIDPTLIFQTFVSDVGAQSFVNVSAVPLPGSLGLFMAALAVLAGLAVKSKLAAK